MNHVQGCAHGCNYPCYAMLMAKRFGKVNGYEEWCKPALVSNTLELLDSEIPKLKHKIKHVHLCFTTDPFMYGYDDVAQMSAASIRRLNDANIPCVVLTKGTLPFELASTSNENEYGATLVSLNEDFRRQYEPGAAPLKERISALRALHDAGCRTWISMEPYPTPNIVDQDLEKLLETVSFVDRIVFGRTNYSKAASSYLNVKHWYEDRAADVICFCKKHGIECHIKRGTMTDTL